MDIPVPATSSEAITVLAHHYRGEIARMISWLQVVAGVIVYMPG